MNIFSEIKNHSTGFAYSAIIGACIGLAAISIFIFGASHYPQEWGAYWRLKPLILTPAAATSGGIFFWLMLRLHKCYNWSRALMLMIGIIGFMVALWIGIVLGLNGTMWD